VPTARTHLEIPRLTRSGAGHPKRSAGTRSRSDNPGATYLVVLATAVLCYAALGAVLGILPSYVHGLGGDAILVGLAVGAPAVTGAAGRPLGGRLADHHGPAAIMIPGALVMAAGTIPAFVSSLPVLVGSRLIVGAGEASTMAAAVLWLLRLVGPRRRGRAMGHIGLANYAGLTIGPPLSQALAGQAHPDRVWITAAALPLLAAGMAAAIRRTRDPAAPADSDSNRGAATSSARDGAATSSARDGAATSNARDGAATSNARDRAATSNARDRAAPAGALSEHGARDPSPRQNGSGDSGERSGEVDDRGTLRITLRPGLGLMLVNVGYVTVLSFGAAAANEQRTGIGPLVIPVFGAGVIASRTILAGIPDRFGAAHTLAVAVVLESAGLAGMAATSSMPVALAALVVMAVGQGLAVPSLGLLALASVPPSRHGRTAGAFFAYFDAGVGLGGPAVGLAARAADPTGALFVAAGAVLGTGPAALLRAPTPRRG
jgi:MFS family permease